MPVWIIAPLVAIVVLKLYLKASCGMCHINDSLCGKIVVVTGANSGIGYETANDLARRGAKVILACRNLLKGQLAAQEITRTTGNRNVIAKCLDLTSFDSIKQFAKEMSAMETKIHILVNNAGTGRLDNSLTTDNLPVEMQTNYFGPFVLTNLLMPMLISGAPSRIVNVASIMHYFGKIDLEKIGKPAESKFQHARVYSNSKLANILFTRQLDKFLEGTKVTANSLHPGAVDTELFRYHPKTVRFILSFFMKTPFEGAQTSIYCAVAPELVAVSGKYFSDCQEGWSSGASRNDEMAKQLWELSENLTNTKATWYAPKEEPPEEPTGKKGAKVKKKDSATKKDSPIDSASLNDSLSKQASSKDKPKEVKIKEEKPKKDEKGKKDEKPKKDEKADKAAKDAPKK